MPRARKAAQSSKASAKTARKPRKTSARSLAMPALPSAPAPTATLAQPKTTLNANAVASYQELIAALEQKVVQITLANNIFAEDNILINHDVAINFNGFSIISSEAKIGARVLDIRSGEITLTGKGKIFAMGKNSVAIRAFGAISNGSPHYTVLTIDEGISLFAPDSYAILLSPNLGVAYGLTVNFSGQIFAHDGICLSSGVRGLDQNMPAINIKNGARIVADELTGTAIEAAGYGKWHIATAHLHGAVGTSLTSGILEFNHAEVIAHRSETFRLLEGQDRLLEVNVDGGAYLAAQDLVVAGDTSIVKSFALKNCDIYCHSDAISPELAEDLQLDHVEFHTDVESFLESQLASAPNFTVEEPAAPATVPKPTPLPELPPEPTLPKPTLVPAAHLPEIAELTDDATDEREIVLELTAEKVARPQSTTLVPPPEPALPVTSEQDAARRALKEAIGDIRKLSAEDYDVGFSELERAIQKAEQILANPLAKLTDIRDAAASLLNAFDGLEERDEDSISDEELDELFYHGAVLEEIVREEKAAKKSAKKLQTFAPEAPKSVAVSAPASPTVPVHQIFHKPKLPTAAPSPRATTPPRTYAPDFTALTDALDTIAELNLDDYTVSSRELLLEELSRAQDLLNNPQASQGAINELSANLLARMSHLQPIPVSSAITHHAATYATQPSAPAPVIKKLILPTMIDEMTPISTWSSGVTMIDELAPFVTDATTREKMLRAVQPKLKVLGDLLKSPFMRLSKSLSAGLHAGISAYRATLHASQH